MSQPFNQKTPTKDDNQGLLVIGGLLALIFCLFSLFSEHQHPLPVVLFGGGSLLVFSRIVYNLLGDSEMKRVEVEKDMTV